MQAELLHDFVAGGALPEVLPALDEREEPDSRHVSDSRDSPEFTEFTQFTAPDSRDPPIHR